MPFVTVGPSDTLDLREVTRYSAQGDEDRVLPIAKTGERLQGMIKDVRLVVIKVG